MLETRGYLELVVDVAEKQLSQPSEECTPKVIVPSRLAEKALCITKRWNKLQRKVKYLGGILSVFSKPWLTMPKFELVSGILSDLLLVSLPTQIYIYLQGSLGMIFLNVSLPALMCSFIQTLLNLRSAFGICGTISCRVRISGPVSTRIQPRSRPSYPRCPNILTVLLEECCSLILLFFFTRTRPIPLTAKPLYNYTKYY